ncbi:PucR family transcriptional regulator ligand-binding domain-containing protein [Bhargavaea ginsengi]|uniref:PucR family transcriptional regulator n=1 Tax=Bhargavaea ginsengi TaxID=426757 RepID=UPI0020420EBE|nr:PucR family transcriptional regulator ligand-binding domain-containing protein [Bhargavaea ginsengi]MCM3088318.1 PucR family transcriptional regulator ligand-binding domain-containing protein [Bhargavaea ginsengi]
MKDIELTVGDILQRESFRRAKLAAGASGLSRKIRWSHILEVREFEALINGGELILTTGISMTLDLDTQLDYIRRLDELGASALCIELGDPSREVAPEVIDLADRRGFPIIVFDKVIRFVDITQDLHTALINRHHKMISELDRLSGRFIELSLTSNGILKILQELHEYFRREAIFIADRPAPYFYPSEAKDSEAALRALVDSEGGLEACGRYVDTSAGRYASVPVRGPGQVWGRLFLGMDELLQDDFYFLILDRAGLAISQVLLRNRTVEERKQNLEDKVVRDLITGRRADPDTVRAVLPARGRNMYYRIFSIRMPEKPPFPSQDLLEEELVQRALLIRSLFQRHGFFPAITSGENEMVVIAFFISEEQQSRSASRFRPLIRDFRNLQPQQFEGSRFGIGKTYQDISDIRKAYRESEDVIRLQDEGITESEFYEGLGIHRLLLLLKRSGELETYVDDYLGALLEHDARHDSRLFETLVVYLECGGVKKEASDRLFIVRQTLYHRIGKLEALLGSNFMDPANRLALEVAIQAYRMLERNETEKPLAVH